MSATCRWYQDPDQLTFHTQCGHAFEFAQPGETPAEGSMGYCCFCGKPIEEVLCEEDEPEGIDNEH